MDVRRVLEAFTEGAMGLKEDEVFWALGKWRVLRLRNGNEMWFLPLRKLILQFAGCTEWKLRVRRGNIVGGMCQRTEEARSMFCGAECGNAMPDW